MMARMAMPPMSVRVLLSMSISAPAMEAKRSSQFRLPNRWPSTAAAIITTPMQELMTTWVPLSHVTFSSSSWGLYMNI